jgi:hypothetical protein
MTPGDLPTCRQLARELYALRRVFGFLDDRVDTIESDLDCDTEGSLAQAIGELRQEVCDLRARMQEWAPGPRHDMSCRGDIGGDERRREPRW